MASLSIEKKRDRENARRRRKRRRKLERGGKERDGEGEGGTEGGGELKKERGGVRVNHAKEKPWRCDRCCC